MRNYDIIHGVNSYIELGIARKNKEEKRIETRKKLRECYNYIRNNLGSRVDETNILEMIKGYKENKIIVPSIGLDKLMKLSFSKGIVCYEDGTYKEE